MTDTQKVEQLEKQLKQTQQESEKLRQESQRLREELDRLRMSQTQGDQDKDPQQEAVMENLRKNYLKLHTEKMDFLAKLEARDEELKQLHDQKAGASYTHPNVTRSISADGILSPDDPKVEVVRLREVVENKQNKIESLEVQLRSFQDVAREKERLQVHSQDQSKVVMGLKKELEAAQVMCVCVCVCVCVCIKLCMIKACVIQGENQTMFKEIESLKTKKEQLKVNVKERDEKIASLLQQLQSFTQTVRDFAKIEKHSKKQSQVVADLKRQLEQREVCESQNI